MSSISFLIRNYNEADALEKCIQSILSQECKSSVEIIVVDNESNDKSLEIARQYGAKIFIIKKGEFTYGKALNIGFKNATGEYVFTISPHVKLLTKHFIKDVEHLLEDKKTGGIRFLNITSPELVFKQDTYEILTPASIKNKKNYTDVWDKLLVCSCSIINRAAWEKAPFDEEIAGNEDKLWTIQALKNDYNIITNFPSYYIYHFKVPLLKSSTKYFAQMLTYHKINNLPLPKWHHFLKNDFQLLFGHFKQGINGFLDNRKARKIAFKKKNNYY